MTIMTNSHETDNAIFKCCEKFIERFHINHLLRNVNAVKEKGIPGYDIFAFLVGLVFTGKNLYTLLSTHPERIPFEKDAIYRFLCKASISWERFISKLCCAVIPDIDRLTSDDRKSALIIDDSP